MINNRILIFMVRVGIACLALTTLFFIFSPDYLNLFSDHITFRKIISNLIVRCPGFDKDWLSVTSFIAVLLYLYGYFALTIITANFFYPTKIPTFQVDIRDKWKLLSYVLVGNYKPKNKFHISNNFYEAEDCQDIFYAIRSYSKSGEFIRSIGLDVVVLSAVSYIGYSALQAPAINGGLLQRFFDALMVVVWCNCIFSIFMCVIFTLTAWLKTLRSSFLNQRDHHGDI